MGAIFPIDKTDILSYNVQRGDIMNSNIKKFPSKIIISTNDIHIEVGISHKSEQKGQVTVTDVGNLKYEFEYQDKKAIHRSVWFEIIDIITNGWFRIED